MIFFPFHVLHQKAPSAGRPPPKRRCLQTSTENNTSCDESPVMGLDENLNGFGDTVPLQQLDVEPQWPDFADHNYCSNKSTKDASTQTDPTPSLSANDMDDKVSKFHTGLDIVCFRELLKTIVAFLPQSKNFRLAVHEQLLLVLIRLRLGLMFTDLGVCFGISRTIACNMFAMWKTVLANFMRKLFFGSLETLQKE